MSASSGQRVLSERGTWRRKSGLVSWSYTMTGAGSSLRDRVLQVVDALDGFGECREVNFTTASTGDETATVEPRSYELGRAFEEFPDTVGVDFSLDLCVRDGNGEAVEPEAAFIWLRLRDEDDPSGLLSLSFSLDVDLYSPITSGRVNDNRGLADLNGPRLTAFLRRLEGMGWVLQDVDAPYHPPGVVRSHGFVASVDEQDLP